MMHKVLYSIHGKSERAYECPRGHVHDVNDHIVYVEEDEYEMMLQEYDTLSETPWVNINNQWERTEAKPAKKNKVPEASE
jgi:hypothetical protein